MPVDSGVCPSCGAQQGPDLLRPAEATSDARSAVSLIESGHPTPHDSPVLAEEPPPSPTAPRSTPGASLGGFVAAVVVLIGALAAGAWTLWGRHHDGGSLLAATTTTRPPTSSVPSTSSAPSTTGPHRTITPLQLTPAWRFDSAQFITAIAGDSNRVFAVTNTGSTAALEALDATTGRRLWRASLGQSSFGQPVASSGLVATVSSTQGTNMVVQIRDGATGRLVWQRGPVLQVRPFLASGNLVVELDSTLDTTIVGLDLRTGQQRWGLPPDVGELVDADTDGKRLFLQEDPGLSAIDGATGRVVWTNTETKGPVTVTADGGLVLAAVDVSTPQSSAGRWHAIDPVSGATRWTRSIRNLDAGREAVLVDGQVVTTSDGIRAYANATGSPSWSHPPTNELRSPPLAAVSTHLLTAGNGSAGPALEELDPSDGAVLRATPVSYPEDILALDHLVVVRVLGGLEAFRY